MDKIASPQQLQAELRRLLAYVESPQPSRAKIARALGHLADAVEVRTAGMPSHVYRLIRDYLSRGVTDIKPNQVEVTFDSEAKANRFEDKARAHLGLGDLTMDDWDLVNPRYDVWGKMDPKQRQYTITISF